MGVEDRTVVSRDNLIVIVLVTVLTTYLATKVLGAIPWAALWYRRHDIANRDEPAPTARDGESGVLTALVLDCLRGLRRLDEYRGDRCFQ